MSSVPGSALNREENMLPKTGASWGIHVTRDYPLSFIKSRNSRDIVGTSQRSRRSP